MLPHLRVPLVAVLDPAQIASVILRILQKGDEVVMTSGLLGKVSKLDGDYLVLKAADNTELKFQKIAVHAVLPKGTLKNI